LSGREQMQAVTTILHLIPTLSGGGAERQLAMLAVEQAKRGLKVHVGVRRGGMYEEPLRAHGVTVRLLGDCRGLNPILLVRIKAWLEEVRPDVVQTWLPQMDILGGVASLWRSVPWVLSERASAPAFRRSSGATWIRRALGRYAAAVIANSRAGAEYWRNTHPLESRVTIVSNAVDTDAIHAAVPLQSSPDRRKLLLVVGRLDHQKAVDVVLRAIALLPDDGDLRVLVLGDGPLRAQLAQLVEAQQLRSRVQMWPFQKDWWGLLKAADLLVSMSRYEGHPNVVLEAMAAGCPLVVSDIPEHREFLSEQSALLVPPEDSAALAAAIAAALADPPSCHARARSAADRVSGLTIQAAADAYQLIYGQATSERLN